MLELDIVLQRFMAQHFNDLTLDELSAFDVMLELPDNEFWDVLQMKSVHLKSQDSKTQDSKIIAQQSIINKIHGLQPQGLSPQNIPAEAGYSYVKRS